MATYATRAEVKAVAARLKEAGSSQRELARVSGMNHSTISRWFSGQRCDRVRRWKLQVLDSALRLIENQKEAS